MSETTEETIDVFEGWESGDDNFLEGTLTGETTSNDTTKVIKEALNTDIKETTEEEQTEEELEKEKELSDETFSDWSGDEITSTESETSEEAEENEDIIVKGENITILETLKEKGLVDYELEEDEELTEELASELIEDSFDANIEKTVEEKIKDLPSVVRQLIKHSINGGDPNQLISSMVKQPTNIITEDMDIEDVNNQKSIIKAARKQKGEDDETIDTYIAFLEESGKLADISKKEFNSVIENKKEFLKTQTAEQAEKRKQQKVKQREFKKDIISLVNDNEQEVKLSRQEKKDLPDYIAEPVVQLPNGNKISGLQNDLFKVLNDKKKTLVLAKLIKNDFDFTDFIADSKTEVVKKVRGINQSTEKKKRSSQPKKKSLADMLD